MHPCRRSVSWLRAGVAAVLLMAAVGCGEASTVDPNALVSIEGEVRGPSDQPLTGRPVRLASGLTGGDAALAVVTVGLSCTAGSCQDRVRTGSTDDSGRYRLEIVGRDTQTSFGNVRPQVLSVHAAPVGGQVSGASIAAGFVVQTTTLRLPRLQLVDPSLALRAGAGSAEAAWSEAPGAPYTVSFEGGSVVPVWQVTTEQTAATVDSRALEGTRGRVVVSGGYVDQVDGSELDVTWRSPGVGYAAAAGAPLSRGRGCRFGTSPPAAACSLTDGDLVSRVPAPSDCPPTETATPTACPAPPRTATIDLGEATAAELVVVRGCEGGCALEISPDGQTFRPAGAADGAFAIVRLPPEAVRAVRVGLGEQGLREVSVWGPVGAEPGLVPLAEESLDELRDPYTVDSDDGAHTAAVAAAVVLAAVGVLGVGYALGTRRRRGEPVRTGLA